MCVGILPACMSVYHLCARCSERPEENIRFPGTGVTDGYELLCGCWKLGSSGGAANVLDHGTSKTICSECSCVLICGVTSSYAPLIP